MNEKNYYGETYAVPASAPMAVQGAYAQGQPMQAQGAYSQGQTIYVSTVHQPQSTDYRSPQLVVNSAVRPSRPMGQWSDSICDWPRNLFPSCWCAVCCCWGIYIQAQMAQKINLFNFWAIIYAAAGFWLLAFILQLVFPGSGAIFIIMIGFSFILALILRLHVYKEYQIQTPGGALAEFCIGFWCCPCSISQMARHMYGYTKVLDGDGDPFRADNYAVAV